MNDDECLRLWCLVVEDLNESDTERASRWIPNAILNVPGNCKNSKTLSRSEIARKCKTNSFEYCIVRVFGYQNQNQNQTKPALVPTLDSRTPDITSLSVRRRTPQPARRTSTHTIADCRSPAAISLPFSLRISLSRLPGFDELWNMLWTREPENDPPTCLLKWVVWVMSGLAFPTCDPLTRQPDYIYELG
ncbi:hypothetical protein LXL04_028664 [Taraxacum kok-saghyz]